MSELDKLIAKWEREYDRWGELPVHNLYIAIKLNLIGKFIRDLKKLKEE